MKNTDTKKIISIVAAILVVILALVIVGKEVIGRQKCTSKEFYIVFQLQYHLYNNYNNYHYYNNNYYHHNHYRACRNNQDRLL